MWRKRGCAILCEDTCTGSKRKVGGLGLLSLQERGLGYGGSAVGVLLLESGGGVGALLKGELGGGIGRSELGGEAGWGGEARWTLWGLTWGSVRVGGEKEKKRGNLPGLFIVAISEFSFSLFSV